MISVIRPDSRNGFGLFGATRALFKELWTFRNQIRDVYKHNFHNSYQGTGMGVVWNYILPLVPMTVYLFLTKIRAFRSFEGVDGSSFLTFGVLVWFVFAGFVQIPIKVTQTSIKTAMRTSIPLSATIASAFANLVFETFIRMVFVLAVMIFTKSWPVATAPLVILIFFLGSFLFLGAGLILAVMNLIYKDVSRVVTIILQYGIFVSGVIFPLGNSVFYQLASKFNPFAVFVNSCREIVFVGHINDWQSLMIWSGIGVIVCLIGCRLFYIMEYRIREIA